VGATSDVVVVCVLRSGASTKVQLGSRLRALRPRRLMMVDFMVVLTVRISFGVDSFNSERLIQNVSSRYRV
jgi:hypothetical protein